MKKTAGRESELAEGFWTFERARGCGTRGIKELRSKARRFFAWLEEEGIDPGSLDRKAAKAYLSYLVTRTTESGKAVGARTVRDYVQAARRFARYLVYLEAIRTDPFAGLRLPRPPKTVPRQVPNEREMETALQALSDWEEAGADPRRQARRYVAHLVAELQYSTGLRIAEAASLEIADLDLERLRVRVVCGKKGKSRVAYLTEYTGRILGLYVGRMREVVLTAKQSGKPESLFGCGYEALSHFQNGQLRWVSEKLGMKLTSHSFRHALGYHLLRSGCPLREIQEILGHERIKDTEVYTKVDGKEVRDVVDWYHPRGREVLGNAD